MEQHQENLKDRLKKEFCLKIEMECQKNARLWTRISNSCLELGWQVKVYKRIIRVNDSQKRSWKGVFVNNCASECVLRTMQSGSFNVVFSWFFNEIIFCHFSRQMNGTQPQNIFTIFSAKYFLRWKLVTFFVSVVKHQMFWSAMWNCDIKAFFVSHYKRKLEFISVFRDTEC